MCSCARFDVANALSIPENNAFLEVVLQDLENDMDWDTNNPIESSYKKKGWKKYKLERVLDFTETSSREITKETFTTSTVGSSSSAIAPLAGASGASLTGETLQVNIEDPDFQTMHQQQHVVESGKMQLEKLYSQALDVKIVLQQKASVDPLYDAKRKGYSEVCDCLNAFLGETRALLYNCKATLEDAVVIVEKCMAHSDCIKSLIKRRKDMF